MSALACVRLSESAQVRAAGEVSLSSRDGLLRILNFVVIESLRWCNLPFLLFSGSKSRHFCLRRSIVGGVREMSPNISVS